MTGRVDPFGGMREMASGMILLLDVGNSRIKAARSDGEKLVSMERYPVDDPNGTARAILENGTHPNADRSGRSGGTSREE